MSMSKYSITASLLGLRPKHLTSILYAVASRDEYYKEIQIPKNGGGIRTIHAVQGPMRMLQRKLYHYLQEKYEPSKYATGFVPGKNIIENAKIHRKNKIIIKYDIKDFFPSITFPRVRGMFMQKPFSFSAERATTFAQICCLDNGGPIPQGAVTSPYISNMICRKLDSRLSGYAKKNRLLYSRYADDMVFSTNQNHLDSELITTHVRQILKEEAFILNEAKTKVLSKHYPQSITGVLVNEGLNLRRTYIRNIRAMLYKCEKTDIVTQAIEYYKRVRGMKLQWTDSKPKQLVEPETGEHFKAQIIKEEFLAHLEGKIQWYGFVARSNRNLNSKHFEVRFALYERLLKRLKKVGQNETDRRDFALLRKHVKDRYSDDPEVQTTIEQILKFGEEELSSFIQQQEQIDVRFYVHPVHIGEFEDRKARVIELLSTPILDPNRTIDLFRLLQDSQNSILGRLVHQDAPILKEELRTFMMTFIENQPELATKLAHLTHNFLKDAWKRFGLTNENPYDFWKDDRFREKIFEYKKRTRFLETDPHTGINLFNNICVIADELEGEISKEKRRIIVNQDNLKDLDFYTDTVSVVEATNGILRSMVDNSKGSKIYIATHRIEESNATAMVICDNNNTPHFPEVPNRSQIGHGKLRSVALNLYGLTEYKIRCSVKDKGWGEINFHTGEVTETPEMPGFSHYLEFPQV